MNYVKRGAVKRRALELIEQEDCHGYDNELEDIAEEISNQSGSNYIATLKLVRQAYEELMACDGEELLLSLK